MMLLKVLFQLLMKKILVMKELKHLTSSSLEDRSLVSHLPLQNSDFNDANFYDLERVNSVEEPIEDNKGSHVLFPPCEEEEDSQEYEVIGTHF